MPVNHMTRDHDFHLSGNDDMYLSCCHGSSIAAVGCHHSSIAAEGCHDSKIAAIASASQDEICLSTISPKDKPWNVHRANSDRVTRLYESTDLERLGNRIRDCAQMLQFAAVETEKGSLGLKLRIAHFCRVKPVLCANGGDQ